MNHIILVSHSNLAKGMYDTVRFFDNGAENITPICAYEDGLNFEAVLIEELDKHKEDKVIIFTDIVGGSVNQIACRLTQKYSNIHIVAGMNLSVVLSVLFASEEINEDFIKQTVEEAKQQLVYMNPMFS